MKKLLIGLIAISSLTTYANTYSDSDSIMKLPQGTQVELIKDIDFKQGVSFYFSDEGTNYKESHCHLRLKQNVTRNQGITLNSTSDAESTPVVDSVKSSWRGDALNMPPGYQLFRININLDNAENVSSVTCELRKTFDSKDDISFEDVKNSLPELKFTLPEGANGKL